jgi:peptide/nickel transport system permease protein
MSRTFALLALAAFLAAGFLDVTASPAAWYPPTVFAPLGGDEFGRNHALVLLVSLGRSLALGTLLASAVIIISTLAGWSISIRQGTIISWLVRSISILVESVPLYLWLLLSFVVLPDRGLLIASIALVVGAVPFSTNVLAGEFARLGRENYVSAARLSGASHLRILVRHILPNATPVLLPLFTMIMGIAVAIPGAIGILGFGRRTDLDLGVILLRGKENALMNPQILLGALAAFVILYLCLYVAGRRQVHGAPPVLGTIPARL